MRMREVTENIPKPLAIIGDRPILWHIMKIYSRYGFNEFILPLGYKGEKIKEYFMNYDWIQNDFILDFSGNENKVYLLKKPEKWKITFIDTGADAMTGDRIKRIQPFIDEDTFLMTYGDGLCDIDVAKLLKYHQDMGATATLTAIEKRSQYGILKAQDGLAVSFGEKTELEGLINGGFFVLGKGIFNYIDHEGCSIEKDVLPRLAAESQLAVLEHKGFWRSADTPKDLQDMNENWEDISKILGIDD